MLKIDNNLLVEVGLGSLPEQERRSLLGQLIETLELRVGMKLAQSLSDEQLDEFEALLPVVNDDADRRAEKEKEALKWLEIHFPDYKSVVAAELDKLKQEIKRDAPKILEAAGQSPQPETS